MKKLFLCITVCVAIFSSAMSQTSSPVSIPDGSDCEVLCLESPLVVSRISSWAPEYLTVTTKHTEMFKSCPSTLNTMSVITEINGKSTKNMTPNDFYDLFCNTNKVTLKYMTKNNGTNNEYVEEIVKLKGFGLANSSTWAIRFCHTVLADCEEDFFNINTFEYILNGNMNKLEQQRLLTTFAEALKAIGMKRDTTNPDVFLYVTLQSNENIETVYQPQLVTTSRTRTYGSYNNRSNYARGDFRTRTITEDHGRFVTNVSTDAYLQITVLDAKKMNQQTPPIIWQYTFNKRVDDRMAISDYEKEIDYVVKIYFPFSGCSPFGRFGYSESHFFTGIFITKGQDGDLFVSGLQTNSIKQKIGINVGDIVKTKSGNVRDKNTVIRFKHNGQYDNYIIDKIGDFSIKKGIWKKIAIREQGTSIELVNNIFFE